MRKMHEALGRVDAAPEPKTEGTDMRGEEIEGLLLEKDELIAQLEMAVESGKVTTPRPHPHPNPNPSPNPHPNPNPNPHRNPNPNPNPNPDPDPKPKPNPNP